ncbi:MAG TPA: hypothetical protein VKM55_09930 [Candidatus Lokiarchaeia archaeon]|nr:hypothetical protein [Candidatus Lokiarchaeia archaeon]
MTDCFENLSSEPEKLGDATTSIRILKQDFFDPVSRAVSTPSWYLGIGTIVQLNELPELILPQIIDYLALLSLFFFFLAMLH